MKSSASVWRYVVNVKSMVKISSIFVAFLENMNFMINTVKLGNKERFVKELIGIKEPFPWPICHLPHLALRNNSRVTKNFLIAKFDCS